MNNLYQKGLTVLLVMVAACMAAGYAQAKDIPEISAQQLKARMDAGEKLLLINPLSDIEYNTKHIPGSINIPLQNILITKRLPKAKDQLIVTYCLGRK